MSKLQNLGKKIKKKQNMAKLRRKKKYVYVNQGSCVKIRLNAKTVKKNCCL